MGNTSKSRLIQEYDRLSEIKCGIKIPYQKSLDQEY